MVRRAAILGPDARRTDFLLKALQPARKLRIADVGARKLKQDPPYEHLRRKDGCEVIGFEPNQLAYDALVEADHPNSTYFKAAIGKPGEAIFYNHPIGSISSLYPISHEAAAFFGKAHWVNRPELQEIPLTLTALDDVEGLDGIDVLKIDIQGGEYEAIKSGAARLADAVVIITEAGFYPMYDGAPPWRELDALLTGMGFVLHKITALHNAGIKNSMRKQFAPKSHNTQLVDGDVVYVRAIDRLDDLDDLQLKHLALAADTLFGSFDLVIACLDRLVERGVIGDGVPSRYFTKLPASVRKG